jgi:hypothetical protein
MPSLANIPNDLVVPARQADFVSWLCDQPIQLDTRRDYAALWRQATNTSLTIGQWREIERTALKPFNPHES